MKKFLLCLLLLLAFSTSLHAQEGARDAAAVLNRCGKPLKGDDTVLTNTLSTRTLNYARGTLLFTRVGDNGWRFASGTHKKQTNLTAQQMAAFLPCLPLALADSAAAAPLQPVSSVQRLAVSAKDSYKQLVLFTLLGLVAIGAILLLISRRKAEDEAE